VQLGTVLHRLYKHQIDGVAKAWDVTHSAHCNIFGQCQGLTQSESLSGQIVNDDTTNDKIICKLCCDGVVEELRLASTEKTSTINQIRDKWRKHAVWTRHQGIQRVECLNRSCVAH
jgi:hypothetical protein